MLGHADVSATGSQQRIANPLVEQGDRGIVAARHLLRTRTEQHARQLRLHDQLQRRLRCDVIRHVQRHRHAVIDDFRVLLLAQRFQTHP